MRRRWLCGFEVGYYYVVVGINESKLGLEVGDVIRFVYDENDDLFVEKKDDVFESSAGYCQLQQIDSLNVLPLFCLPFLHRCSKTPYVVARIEDASALISGVPVEDVYV